MEKFFEEIKEKIKEAVKKDVPNTKKELGKEKPYAFAFVTDSDYCTLWLGVNTYEFLKKRDAEYGDGYTTKWDPDDWGYTIAERQLGEIGEELSDKMDSVMDDITSEAGDDLSFEQYFDLLEKSGFPKLFIESLISVFQDLIKENFFGLDSNEVAYFITMTDDDKAQGIENNSAKVLN